ncbi:MAG: NAAT family transporter [Deltaproteobacteria bacterium]|nr:NAAT family transporter [Deltaproteobacteria bacterium]
MSSEDIKFAVVAMSAVFFVVDPLAAIPIFLTITSGDLTEAKKRIAARTSLAVLITLTTFALAGGLIFKAFGISLGAFKIAGGLMIFLMAVDMMRAQPSPTRSTAEEQEESVNKDDVAIVPMAIPMLSGPGAIATVMVLMSRAAWKPVQVVSVFFAIASTALATWLLLRASAHAERVLSKTTIRVVERIMGLLLAAIAVEFVIGGLRDLLPTMQGHP